MGSLPEAYRYLKAGSLLLSTASGNSHKAGKALALLELHPLAFLAGLL